MLQKSEYSKNQNATKIKILKKICSKKSSKNLKANMTKCKMANKLFKGMKTNYGCFMDFYSRYKQL